MRAEIQWGGWSERRAVAVLSLAATWLFFAEYLPPWKRVHLVWDVPSFHYPLLNYAFQSLREGRFPEWDPGIYCGTSFAGKTQAALFYPPTWLLFAANARRAGVSFSSVQVYVALHFWIGFFLAYLWLRDRGLDRGPTLIGAASFAWCGFLLNESQHLGVTTGIVWFPLAFWGIDEASRLRRWRPLWKVAAASALCFLAGYPFLWIVLCLLVTLYALTVGGRSRLVPACFGALAISLAISAVQILPAAEAASMQVQRETFGGGLPRLADYFTAIAPNYFDQAGSRPPSPDEPYFYIGAPALFAMGWLMWRGAWRAAIPAVVLVAGCHLVMWNPLDATMLLLRKLPPLNQMVREWYGLASLPPAFALLAAAAAHDFLSRKKTVTTRRNRLAIPAVLLAAAWCARQLLVWSGPTQSFLTGWANLAEVGVTLACFVLALAALGREWRTGWREALLAAALLVVWTDFKVYGTSRRFNAERGNPDRTYAADARLGGPDLVGMDRATWRQLRGDRLYRVVNNDDPSVADIRHYRLSSPQGSDPALPSRYRDALEGRVEFVNERTFKIDPGSPELLQSLGVKYVLTIRGGPGYQAALRAPHLRLMDTTNSFSAVFVFRDALPPWRWPGTASCAGWTPERREFRLRSPEGGDFALIEQFYPGWSATLDGNAIAIHPWQQAFQKVSVPAGEHTLVFEYRARGLRAGAGVSAAAVLLLIAAYGWSGRRDLQRDLQ